MSAKVSPHCENWPGKNGHYFTLRTTFNQPGHLATVVAFDLPINDLIPPGMPLDSFRIEPDATPSDGAKQ
ncbi:two-component system sensor kinase [Salmonella enterica subsp. enterica]|uniref:Two-component system sensor kinase n=1 Tax=Salmonella enterica I TaxID=59201 RepID=A0A3S4I2G2_SALET|nr:two-component system sensor kinase [Salmonella enterica subsp. enterica]